MSDLSRLVEPEPWPPPELPPPSRAEEVWRDVPIIGQFVARHIYNRRARQHLNDVLTPIERQILDQLDKRETLVVGSVTNQQEQIIELLSVAISEEKSIDPPLLRRDDRVDILFWGANDDITLFIFGLSFDKCFGTRIHLHVREWINRNEPKTVQDFVNFHMDVIS